MNTPKLSHASRYPRRPAGVTNNKMIPQVLNRRWAVAAFVIFAASLVWVWLDQLRPTIETTLPILTHHPKVPVQRTIQCPLGAGQPAKNRAHSNATLDNDMDTVGIPKVVALVFYGRRATVSIMDCYLKRNLVKNGGLLEEVIWLERTGKEEDIHFLDKLIESEDAYSRRKIDTSDPRGYGASYDNLEDGTMYVKIDDDVVYMDDDAIAAIVCTKAQRPDYFIVSANVVNQPMISWMHWNLGAILPYLPEVEQEYPAPEEGKKLDWRASKLPTWKGPKNFDINDWNDTGKHRWLPLRDQNDHVLDRTPIEKTQYDPFGKGLGMWEIGAQEHYSFLDHLENEETWKYKFNVWDFQYKRMGIQFVAFMGYDINHNKPIDRDDEEYLAVAVPRKLGRHAVADGRAVVVHYAFGPQTKDGKGMHTTDVLERYRSYAREKACAGPMLWTPKDP